MAYGRIGHAISHGLRTARVDRSDARTFTILTTARNRCKLSGTWAVAGREHRSARVGRSVGEVLTPEMPVEPDAVGRRAAYNTSVVN
jgi:hypothetical protein